MARIKGRPKGIPSAKTQCRYCAREMSTIRIGTHERVCIHNSTVRAAVVATMASATPGEGVTMSQYAARSAGDLTIPDVTTLRRATGARDWAGVLAEFGLVPQTPTPATAAAAPTPDKTPTPAQAAELAMLDDVDEQRKRAREILLAERNHEYGIAVAKVLPAPGLRINGRECVRCVLR